MPFAARTPRKRLCNAGDCAPVGCSIFVLVQRRVQTQLYLLRVAAAGSMRRRPCHSGGPLCPVYRGQVASSRMLGAPHTGLAPHGSGHPQLPTRRRYCVAFEGKAYSAVSCANWTATSLTRAGVKVVTALDSVESPVNAQQKISKSIAASSIRWMVA